MNAPVKVVLWRHGRTGWNAESRFQGTSDIALDAVGTAQAHRAARELATLGPDLVVASDLGRAVDTARALAAIVDLPVATDPALRETYAGSWQGRTREEITAQDPQGFRQWLAGHDVRAGGGESRSEVGDRVAAAVERHAATLPAGGTLVAVTHGGATRAGIGRAAGTAGAALGLARRSRQLRLVGARAVRAGVRAPMAPRRAQRPVAARGRRRRRGLTGVSDRWRAAVMLCTLAATAGGSGLWRSW